MKRISAKLLCVFLCLATLISTMSAAVFALPDFEDDYGAFLEKLGYYESRNTYNITNEYGYLGRWQLGHLALQDVGFMSDSKTYSDLAASYGVKSDEDFLNSPAAQDYCVQALHKKIWGYIRYYGDEQYLGQTMWNIKITISGMVAAAHLVGAGALHEMLKSGVVATDANGSTATFYLKELGGYNISKSIGTTITDPATPTTPSEPSGNESTIYFYENYSGTNYLLATDFSSSINSSLLKSRDAGVYSLSIDKTNAYENENSLKIVGSSAGSPTKDIYWSTQTSPGTNEGYAGDSKTMTLSFYAKANVSGAKMYWRFGYGSEYEALNLTTAWKKYTLTFTKKSSDGNVLHPYFSKAGTFYLNNVTLVDGSTTATLTSHESKASQYSSLKATVGKKYSSLPNPTRSGYTFDGWYTAKIGGTKITTSTTAAAKDTIAYAHWTKDTTYIPVKTSSYNGHYYSVFNDDLSWNEAKTVCEKMGGHLVTIGSLNENNFVKNLVASQSKGVYWIGAKLSASSWSWVTGEAFSYKNWAAGQPSGGENYAEIYSRQTQTALAGSWNDVNEGSSDISYYSTKNTGYICEFEPEQFTTDNGYYLNGNLYKVYDKQLSWENANSLASYNKGHLVTITSTEEYNFVKEMAKQGSSASYWIGFTDKSSFQDFKWVTGEKITYTNWSSGYPSNKNSIDRYVEFNSNRRWSNVKNTGKDDIQTGCIIEFENYSLALESIVVVSKPDKTNYIQGEELDPTGLVVRANYEYGVKEFVTGYKLSGYDKNATGLQKVTVTYNGKTVQFSVYTSKKTTPVSSVSLNKTSLSLEAGSSASLAATVSPSDATNKKVTWSSDNTAVATVSSDGKVTAVSAGKATVSVKTNDGSYTAKCSVTVTEKKLVVKALQIAANPTKTTYEVGENLDLSGMKVNVEYDNGTKKDVTSKCSVSGFDSSSAGEKKVTVSYTESGKTVSTSFTVTVNQKSDDDSPLNFLKIFKWLSLLKEKIMSWLKIVSLSNGE